MDSSQFNWLLEHHMQHGYIHYFFLLSRVFTPLTDLIIMNQYTDKYVPPIFYVYCMLWIPKLLSFYLVFDE